MDIKQFIPRFMLSKEIKRCGNCRHNNDYCYIKEVQNPCTFWAEYPTPAKRAKLYKITTEDIKRHNKRKEKFIKRAKQILND